MDPLRIQYSLNTDLEIQHQPAVYVPAELGALCYKVQNQVRFLKVVRKSMPAGSLSGSNRYLDCAITVVPRWW